MRTERLPINSSPSLEDSRFWQDLQATPGGVVIGPKRGNNDGKDLLALTCADCKHKLADANNLLAAEAALHAPDDLMILAIGLDGHIVIEPEGTTAIYLAHLGFYRRSTDTLELLDFRDDTPPPPPDPVRP